MIQFIHRLIWFVALLLIQVLVLDRVHILGYATPLLYIYYIVMQRTDVPRKQLIWQAFLLGLLVDMFCNTPGMNAAASTFLAFVRGAMLRMQTLRGMSEEYTPGIRVMGMAPFVRYVICCVFIQALFLHLLDAFSLFSIGNILLQVLADTLITVVCILCVDMIRRKN